MISSTQVVTVQKNAFTVEFIFSLFISNMYNSSFFFVFATKKQANFRKYHTKAFFVITL